MKTTCKAAVLLAVVCLLAMPFSALAIDGGADATKTDECALINVSGTFEDNKEQLKVLGIEDPSAWTFNSEYQCYQLELGNIDFSTSCAVGVIFYSFPHAGFALKVTGESSISSGSEYPEWYLSREACTIWAYNCDLAVIGGGKLTVSNGISGTDTTGSSALWVDGRLTVAEGTHLVGKAAGFTHESKESLDEYVTPKYSVGIHAKELSVFSDKETTRIIGIGGDVTVKYAATVQSTEEWIMSFGIYCPSISAENSYIATRSGDVGYVMDEQSDLKISITSKSIGLDMTDGIYDEGPFSACFVNCKVVGISGDAVGNEKVESKGITLKSDDVIRIHSSVILTTSSNARCTDPESSYTTVYGMEFYSVVEINDSLVSGYGYGVSGAMNNFSLGLHGKRDMHFNRSIINAHGENVGLCPIKIAGGEFNYMYINDTDIFSYGKVRAINGDPSKIIFSSGLRYCVGTDSDGNTYDIKDATQLISTDNKAVELAYKYDVIISHDGMSADSFLRCDSKVFTIPAFDGTAPEGQVFDKWYLDGEETYVGEIVSLGDVSYLSAQFKDAPADSNTAIAVAAIVIAAIALLLLAMSFIRPRH